MSWLLGGGAAEEGKAREENGAEAAGGDGAASTAYTERWATSRSVFPGFFSRVQALSLSEWKLVYLTVDVRGVFMGGGARGLGGCGSVSFSIDLWHRGMLKARRRQREAEIKI